MTQEAYTTEIETFIATSNGYAVKRLYVPGGWLLIVESESSGDFHMEFIHDPVHNWLAGTDEAQA